MNSVNLSLPPWMTPCTPIQQKRIIDLCAKFRPFFYARVGQLHCLRSHLFHSIRYTSCGSLPLEFTPAQSLLIENCCKEMLELKIIAKRPSVWCSPCCVIAKNGSPRFRCKYRHTLEKHLIRESSPLPNMYSCPDPVGWLGESPSLASSALSGDFR